MLFRLIGLTALLLLCMCVTKRVPDTQGIAGGREHLLRFNHTFVSGVVVVYIPNPNYILHLIFVGCASSVIRTHIIPYAQNNTIYSFTRGH